MNFTDIDRVHRRSLPEDWQRLIQLQSGMLCVLVKGNFLEVVQDQVYDQIFSIRNTISKEMRK